MNVDIATHQAVVNLQRVCCFIEKVFAGLQRFLAMDAMPQHKSQRVSNHARRLEFRGDPAGGISRPQHYELLPIRRDGHIERPRQPAASGQDGKQQKC